MKITLLKGKANEMDYLMNILLLTTIYFLVFHPKWRLKSKRTFILNTTFYFYIVVVLFFTIMPFRIPLGATNNLMSTAIFIPFYDLIQGYYGAVRDIVLNIIMLMPFGFLLPLIRVTNVFKTVFLTFLFSLSIESYQLVNGWWGTSSRIFDVTDLMTNTFGGFIGYVIWFQLATEYNKSLISSQIQKNNNN